MNTSTTHTSRTARAILAAAAALGGAAAAHAQPCGLGKLIAGDGAQADFFGSAVSLYSNDSGLRVMVGARFDDTAAGANAGSVYTYGRFANGQWGFLAQVFASDGQVGDYFGYSLDTLDPHAVIGAPGAGVGGATYFFERVGAPWEQRSRLTLGSPIAGDDFGASVAISGAWAVAGAPGRDFASNENGGAAYFCRRQANGTWIHHSGARGDNQFGLDAGSRLGSAVAMYGNVAVIGAPLYTSPNWPSQHGVARVYRRDAQEVWQWEDVLSSNNPGEADHYGAAVAAGPNFIAIGAPQDDRTAAQGGVLTDSGCVYIRRYSGGVWTVDGQIFAPDASSYAHFGSSLKMDGERLVVGASAAGKAYIFRRVAGEWVCDEVVRDPEGPGGFGADVDILGDTVAVGDELDDPSGVSNAGAVYVRRPSTSASDSCAGAMPIIASTYAGCTEFATRDGTTTCGNPPLQGPDVWYAWTPSCSGNVIIDTIGSAFDTVLSVHTGCPDDAGATTVACNDDAGASFGTDSMVTFEAVAGTRYLVRVSGYNGAAGEFALRVAEWQAPANDTCTTAQPIAAGQHTAATCRAHTDGPPVWVCGTGSEHPMVNDLWYRYTAQCNGTVTVDTCGSAFDTVLAVYAGAICPTQAGPAMVCNDDAGSNCAGSVQSRVTFSTQQGSQYLIRVGGFDQNSVGDLALNIACEISCPADWNRDGTANSSDISAFLTTWLASVTGGTLQADFNADGTTNSTDISAFLTAWLDAVTTGC